MAATEHVVESLDRIGALDLAALRGLTAAQATAVQEALDVTTIRDLAMWPPQAFARRLVTDTTGATVDIDEAQTELLRTRFGDHPTESVYYSTLVMLQMNETATQDVVDLDPTDVLAVLVHPGHEAWAPPALAGVGARRSDARGGPNAMRPCCWDSSSGRTYSPTASSTEIGMTTRKELTAASPSTCRAPSGWQDFLRRNGIPPFPLARTTRLASLPPSGTEGGSSIGLGWAHPPGPWWES